MDFALDKDLQSIQEVRNLIAKAKIAQKQIATFSQEKIDAICSAMAEAGAQHAARLGAMAQQETGFGRANDKKVKNELGSVGVWNAVKDMKTVGIINDDKEQQIIDVAVPMGVIAGLVPSTNPTSTVFFKSIISLKSGNSIVFSPHPSAKECIKDAARVMQEAASSVGCPADAISVMDTLTISATNELMKHKDTALILATGGEAMVRAAYSSGRPAIGVGPGNGPAYIERTADVELAVKRILDSKTFDNGTICASEQSVIVEECNKEAVIEAFKKRKAYFLNPEEKKALAAILMRANGTMNPAVVGKSAHVVATLAGISVPEDTSVLLGFESEVGPKVPFSKEKLCPVLAFYTTKNWEEACELSVKILLAEGAGHTLVLHTQDEAVIREFALKKPVSRLLVNTPGALGGVGATTNLLPSLTLGCGAIGGSSSSDNIGPLHLINIRRTACGVREYEDLVGNSSPVPKAKITKCAIDENAVVEAILARLLEKL